MPWFTGDEVAALSDVANIADAFCKANGGHRSWRYSEEVNDGYVAHAPVGSLAPNGFGLHDVHGNVYEWCEDVYGSYTSATADGTVRTQSGSGYCVRRGGGWYNYAWFCRSANRFGFPPGGRSIYLGFRPASKVLGH